MSELCLQNATFNIPTTRAKHVYELLRERISGKEIAEFEDVIIDINKVPERRISEEKEPDSHMIGALSVKFHGILYNAAKVTISIEYWMSSGCRFCGT